MHKVANSRISEENSSGSRGTSNSSDPMAYIAARGSRSPLEIKVITLTPINAMKYLGFKIFVVEL